MDTPDDFMSEEERAWCQQPNHSGLVSGEAQIGSPQDWLHMPLAKLKLSKAPALADAFDLVADGMSCLDSATESSSRLHV